MYKELLNNKYQAYDIAILNLMQNNPECRTYKSIFEKAKNDKYLETIVKNALNHLYDNQIINIQGKREDIKDNCKIILNKKKC
jgi:hypothetical protein